MSVRLAVMSDRHQFGVRFAPKNRRGTVQSRVSLPLCSRRVRVRFLGWDFFRKPSRIKIEFLYWCPGEGRHKQELSIACRVPPLPNVPLTLNRYFRDCPTDFSAASHVCFSLVGGHRPAQSVCRLCAISGRRAAIYVVGPSMEILGEDRCGPLRRPLLFSRL
jgi:hypothetical protein